MFLSYEDYIHSFLLICIVILGLVLHRVLYLNNYISLQKVVLSQRQYMWNMGFKRAQKSIKAEVLHRVRGRYWGGETL